jgi:GTP-binding protein
MHFLDQAKISSAPGRAGRGAVSFRREKYARIWRPQRRYGGKGGDVIFGQRGRAEHADRLPLCPAFQGAARRRRRGHQPHRRGRRGYGIKVPVGTQVLDDDRETVLADITEAGQRITCCAAATAGAAMPATRPPPTALPASTAGLAGRGNVCGCG